MSLGYAVLFETDLLKTRYLRNHKVDTCECHFVMLFQLYLLVSGHSVRSAAGVTEHFCGTHFTRLFHDLIWASYQIYKIEGCACAGNAGNVFSHQCELAIPIYIMARVWCTCRDACRDGSLAVSFKVGSGENVSDIPGACTNHNFAYLW